MKLKLLSMILFVSLLSGCGGKKPWSPTEIIKHPDAAMLILEARGDSVRVAVWDGDNKKLIEYGWVQMDASMVGKTIYKLDWEKAKKKIND